MAWQEQWNSAIFTYEKRFCLDGPDGYLYYFHEEKKKNFLPLITTAGVMVWSAISSKGFRNCKWNSEC
jgi:hypothetical protein